MLWIIFTSFSDKTISQPNISNEFVDVENGFEVAANIGDSERYVPRDNDAVYSLPAYVPTHNHSMPRDKIKFNEVRDNDELYYTPVAMPKNLPKNTVSRAVVAPKPAPQLQPVPQYVPQYAPQYIPQAEPAFTAVPVAPVAPLQPQAQQQRLPAPTPQYQQYQQPAYQAPAAQQPETEREEYYPLYYY